MKRSNRLVILVGVLLAVLAFVAIVILLNQDRGADGGAEEPTTVTVLVATEDIDIGEPVTPDKVEPQEVDPAAVIGTALSSASQLQGQPALLAVPAGAQVSGEAVGLGDPGTVIDIAAMLDPGEKAIAFQVDRVTGLDFLVNAGDSIDIVISPADQRAPGDGRLGRQHGRDTRRRGSRPSPASRTSERSRRSCRTSASSTSATRARSRRSRPRTRTATGWSTRTTRRARP